jgi:hypothetical protein
MVLQNSARQNKAALMASSSAGDNGSEEPATANAEQSAGEARCIENAGSTTSTSPARTTTVSIHRRQNDGGSTDADDAARRLIPWVRYSDLYEANIVRSWTQLSRMIDTESFPVGKMLSPNVRAWRLDEVEAWLAHRPASRKVPPPATKPRGRDRTAS